MTKNEKFNGVRRQFLQTAGAWLMVCGLKAENVEAASKNRTPFKVLDKNDHFDIGDRGKEIIQKAYDLGYEYEEKHKGWLYTKKLFSSKDIVTSIEEFLNDAM